MLSTVALFYAYGAFVHVANMLSMTGFHWPEAPLKWQVLDVAYLGLDVLVALGLWRQWRASIIAFFIAAFSQIALYTVGRGWIMDVPEAYAQGPEAMSYLDALVVFHVVSMLLVVFALRMSRYDAR